MFMRYLLLAALSVLGVAAKTNETIVDVAGDAIDTSTEELIVVEQFNLTVNLKYGLDPEGPTFEADLREDISRLLFAYNQEMAAGSQENENEEPIIVATGIELLSYTTIDKSDQGGANGSNNAGGSSVFNGNRKLRGQSRRLATAVKVVVEVVGTCSGCATVGYGVRISGRRKMQDATNSNESLVTAFNAATQDNLIIESVLSLIQNPLSLDVEADVAWMNAEIHEDNLEALVIQVESLLVAAQSAFSGFESRRAAQITKRQEALAKRDAKRAKKQRVNNGRSKRDPNFSAEIEAEIQGLDEEVIMTKDDMQVLNDMAAKQMAAIEKMNSLVDDLHKGLVQARAEAKDAERQARDAQRLPSARNRKQRITDSEFTKQAEGNAVRKNKSSVQGLR